MSAKNKKTILLLLVVAVLLAVVPFFAKKGAEFGGSDDAGSVMVEEIKGEAYECEGLVRMFLRFRFCGIVCCVLYRFSFPQSDL